MSVTTSSAVLPCTSLNCTKSLIGDTAGLSLPCSLSSVEMIVYKTASGGTDAPGASVVF